MALTFLSISENKTKDKHIKWFCKCSCGDVSEYIATRVRNNYVKNCKKCRDLIVSKKNTVHGMKKTKEYATWVSIKQRCLNSKNKDFYKYGQKGIYVHKDWINSFQNFFDYIGKAPNENYSIDRIDNLKGYEPGNVRWATRQEQQRNKNNTVYVTDGKNIFHINDVASNLGISRGAAHLRLKRGKLNGYKRN